MSQRKLALKIDVDTEVGTRIGVPNLLRVLEQLQIPATFYLSLGPDNTGRAIRRIFRAGFLKKVLRTKVVSTYGLATLLNGLFFPGPHIGRRHAKLLASIAQRGFEVGIHAYDHQKWQDGALEMTPEAFEQEFARALLEFRRIFGVAAVTAAAPGWQVNENVLAAYERAQLLYSSDVRGSSAFFPKMGARTYKTLQLPTTLPTLDELLGRREFPLAQLPEYYWLQLQQDSLNVLTLHAELEGMKYLEWFQELLLTFRERGVIFVKLSEFAQIAAERPTFCGIVPAEIDGRAGKVGTQQF